MSATVDHDGLLELLHELDRYSLPFAVRPRRGGDLRALSAAVEAAIDAANLSAVARVPDDPSWCTECAVSQRAVVAELAKGTMTDDEVSAWFADFVSMLGPAACRIEPHPPDKRVPGFWDWIELPPSLTAFLDFVPADPDERLWRPAAAVRNLADQLTAWGRLPGGTAITMRGQASFVTPAAAAADELRTSWDMERQFGLWQLTRRPRRARIVQVELMAKGFLQVVDEIATAEARLPDVLSGLRILAPHLRQARVRRARTAAPDELDAPYVLGRPATDAEQWASTGDWGQLLSEFLVDAYVAQVLTTAHLEKIGSPPGFLVEELGHDRYLVVASEPGPWLSGLNPDPEVQAEARRAFSPAMLTAEVAAAHRRLP